MSRIWIGTLDRYIFTEFIRALLGMLAFFAVLSVVIVLFSEVDEFLKNDPPWSLVIQYIACSVPYFISRCLPFAVLAAVTFTLGRLSRNRELQAMIVGGYRAHRIAWPILVTVAVFALVTPFFHDIVVAPAWQKAEDLMVLDIKNKGELMTGRRDIWLIGQDERTFHVAMHRPYLNGLYGVDIIESDPETAIPIRRLRVRQAFYQPSGTWHFEDVVERRFNPDGTVTTQFHDSYEYQMDETPERFLRMTQKPEDMSLKDLREEVYKAQKAGLNSARFQVYLTLKGSAFPFGFLVLSLIGICFSLQPGSGSLSIGLGLSLIMAFAYYVGVAFCVSFVENGILHPVAGPWIPNLVIGIPALGAFIYKDQRT